MYRKVQDFLDDWKYESEATLKIFANLNDDALNDRSHPDVRTLGRLAWHITITVSEMLNRTGLTIEGPKEEAPVPGSVKEISQAYKESADSVLKHVSEKWNDASLEEEVNMYGQMWKKGTVLSSLVNHQIHHRAQMTVLMRQHGLKVVGIYGPAKEEWAAMNMPPAE
jgi:uncharacterized damage-inducible protein DinB